MMLAHMNFGFLVDRKLLKMRLDVVKYAAGVLKSPGKLIIFSPTVSWVQCVSDFCLRISATIIPQVTFLPTGTFSLGIKKIVLVPYGLLVTSPCYSRQILFTNEFSPIALVGSLIICIHYMDAPIVGSMTTLA